MINPFVLRTVSLVAVAGFLALQLPAVAQDSAPSSNQGLEGVVLQTIDLGNEIQGLEGRQLRLRKLTLEPGGHIAIHSHKDRPAVAYVLAGTTTVTFGDGSVKQFNAGDSISANKNTMHWHRNEGSVAMTLVTVDVFKTPN
jgi:quercetin dioxygenase-like cupin family protein